ncbi:hypothetical protein T265_11871 [Opisthorchis viverrini]|uniref:Uncharacterized protein n=1 Tax=Opisthorchis viverrini TaxID=6198 RepID=A0A074ZVW1_OPIVI|nr:hypothetical protein T265_11871 [Opisthorchis viverrini]KER19319.1 hypothetical protein T265_11871 [Opisthorchis viverrini]
MFSSVTEFTACLKARDTVLEHFAQLYGMNKLPFFVFKIKAFQGEMEEERKRKLRENIKYVMDNPHFGRLEKKGVRSRRPMLGLTASFAMCYAQLQLGSSKFTTEFERLEDYFLLTSLIIRTRRQAFAPTLESLYIDACSLFGKDQVR